MKNFAFLSIVFQMLLLFDSCKHDSEIVQTFDYYDFPDVVLKYPTDTSTIDSALISFTPASANDVTAYLYYNNSFGLADSFRTNKYLFIALNNHYQVFKAGFGGYCCELSFYNDVISPNDATHNYHFTPWDWSPTGIILADLVESSHSCNSPNLGEFYLPSRREENDFRFAGWIHGAVYPDSIVFYDCAFSHQQGISINAGQH